jgi:hypothetical protein
MPKTPACGSLRAAHHLHGGLTMGASRIRHLEDQYRRVPLKKEVLRRAQGSSKRSERSGDAARRSVESSSMFHTIIYQLLDVVLYYTKP